MTNDAKLLGGPPDLTAEDVDRLLERFDQTDPAIQRGIVARFVSAAVWYEDRCNELEADRDRLLAAAKVAERFFEYAELECPGGFRESLKAVREALAGR